MNSDSFPSLKISESRFWRLSPDSSVGYVVQVQAESLMLSEKGEEKAAANTRTALPSLSPLCPKEHFLPIGSNK